MIAETSIRCLKIRRPQYGRDNRFSGVFPHGKRRGSIERVKSTTVSPIQPTIRKRLKPSLQTARHRRHTRVASQNPFRISSRNGAASPLHPRPGRNYLGRGRPGLDRMDCERKYGGEFRRNQPPEILSPFILRAPGTTPPQLPALHTKGGDKAPPFVVMVSVS